MRDWSDCVVAGHLPEVYAPLVCGLLIIQKKKTQPIQGCVFLKVTQMHWLDAIFNNHLLGRERGDDFGDNGSKTDDNNATEADQVDGSPRDPFVRNLVNSLILHKSRAPFLPAGRTRSIGGLDLQIRHLGEY